jgi:hypothetical protein
MSTTMRRLRVTRRWAGKNRSAARRKRCYPAVREAARAAQSAQMP